MPLSIIVPITKMSGKLQNLEGWVFKACQQGIEVILVHDKRDEETSVDLKRLKMSTGNPNLVLLEKEYGNQGTARNDGISVSQGAWLAFWDSDDFGDPSTLLSAINRVRIDTDLIIGQYRMINTENHILFKSDTEHLLKLSVNLGLWRMIFRKEKLQGTIFPPLQMGEDQVFFVRSLSKIRNIEFCQDNFYSYVSGTPGQITKDKTAIKQIPIAIRYLLKELDNVNNLKRKSLLIILVLRLTLSSIKQRFRLLQYG